MSSSVSGGDRLARCQWGYGPSDYRLYHDCEWGCPVADERQVFEKLCLEGFQSGLSWLTVLRKRDAFRAEFAGFEPAVVAQFGSADVERLLRQPTIIRHRGKIEATITNARAVMAMQAEGLSLAGLVWSFAPAAGAGDAAREGGKGAAHPPGLEGAKMSKALRSYGMRFVGPTTAFSAMQALGVVNGHEQGCFRYAEVQRQRERFVPPGLLRRVKAAKNLGKRPSARRE